MIQNADTEMVGTHGRWSKHARDHVHVEVTWRRGADGAVGGVVRDTNHDHPPSAFDFDLDIAARRRIEHRLGPIDVVVYLHVTDQRIALKCNLPLSNDQFFDGVIAEWRPAPSPPCNPGIPEGQTAIIDVPCEPMDLFPLLWLAEQDVRPSHAAQLRFTHVPHPQQLRLYQVLAACTGPDAAAEKRAAAAAFMGTPAFVSALGELPVPISGLPQLRLEFEAIAGELPLSELILRAELYLRQTLDEFLHGPPWISAQAQVWQSLFALALSGSAPQRRNATGLVELVRMAHVLELLRQREAALCLQPSRREALGCIAVMPDAVAACELSLPMLDGAGDRGELLGVGMLHVVQQRLAGYLPGELADVVNVLPHQRQELRERHVRHVVADSRALLDHVDQFDTEQRASAIHELKDAVQELLTADGTTCNMDKVNTGYQNLNLILSGKWSDARGRTAWSDQTESQVAQRLTERAARHVGERVNRQRARAWRELHDSRYSQTIDNTGAGRLVGVYRWIDRMMCLQLQRRGRRVVLAFDIHEPAQDWLARVAAAGPIPLQPPPALPESYKDICARNYQTLAAQFGQFDVAAPPPRTLTVATTVTRIALADRNLLTVPNGYRAVAGTVTLAWSDNSYSLAWAVGSVSAPLFAPHPPAPLNMTLPSTAAEDLGPLSVQPVSPPLPAFQVVEIPPLPDSNTGAIPITVICAAPSFAVTVELVCQRGDGDQDPLYTAWQLRIYRCVQEAWQAQTRQYAAALEQRAQHASAGQAGEIQRCALREACLQVLRALVAQQPGTQQRLAALFGWHEMTWRYASWFACTPPAVHPLAPLPSEQQLFQRFLKASAARVLLPVAPGEELALLYCLQFRQWWCGEWHTVPATACSVPLLEQLYLQQPERLPACPDGDRWWVRVPTSVLYLQESAELPWFGRHAGASAPAGEQP